MRYSFPDGARLYCRNCREEQPHLSAGRQVMRTTCGRLTKSAEIAAIYATDDERPRPRIILPARLMPDYVEDAGGGV